MDKETRDRLYEAFLLENKVKVMELLRKNFPLNYDQELELGELVFDLLDSEREHIGKLENDLSDSINEYDNAMAELRKVRAERDRSDKFISEYLVLSAELIGDLSNRR